MAERFGTPALCLLLAAAVRLPMSGVLPVALTGALAAPLAAIVAAELVGPRAAPAAGLLMAASPIHTLASRQAGPEVLLVLGLLLALWLLAALEREGRRALAIALGMVCGGLAASGVTAFAAVAVLLPSWVAARPERRTSAWLSAGVALSIVAAAASLGLARSALDYGEIPPGIPLTTARGLVRCAGASLTRVIGLEYQLAFAHARYLLPLTLLFVALMFRGAVRLPARPRGLLLAGALLPFAVGATMAGITGRVVPLQATRLVAALPFVTLLMAAGLASLKGNHAWLAAAIVGGSLVVFLVLALAH